MTNLLAIFVLTAVFCFLLSAFLIAIDTDRTRIRDIEQRVKVAEAIKQKVAERVYIPTAMEDWDAEFERLTKRPVQSLLNPPRDAWMDLSNRILPHGDKALTAKEFADWYKVGPDNIKRPKRF